MFEGNYRVCSTGSSLSNLILINDPREESAYSGKIITLRSISPAIKTKKGFFQLCLKKEVTKGIDEKCSEIYFFTVVKIANENKSSIDSTPLSDKVQRFSLNNFDDETALLEEIDIIFRENFL